VTQKRKESSLTLLHDSLWCGDQVLKQPKSEASEEAIAIPSDTSDFAKVLLQRLKASQKAPDFLSNPEGK